MPHIAQPASYIFPLGSNELMLQEYINFVEPFASESYFYAVTLTLNPSEHKILFQRNLDSVDYFKYKIQSLGLFDWYVFVEEVTKNKVSHLHGICILNIDQKEQLMHSEIIKKGRKGRNKYDHILVNKNLDCQNVYKLIKSSRQMYWWIKYLRKNMISSTMLNYITISNAS